jgi:hypothetical protein
MTPEVAADEVLLAKVLFSLDIFSTKKCVNDNQLKRYVRKMMAQIRITFSDALNMSIHFKAYLYVLKMTLFFFK